MVTQPDVHRWQFARSLLFLLLTSGADCCTVKRHDKFP